jgi:phosphate acetyltransferase
MAIAPIAPPVQQRQAKYERLITRAKQVLPASMIVVHPCDESSLRGVVEAAESGIIVPVLVGPAERMRQVAREHKLDIERFEIVDAGHSDAAAAKGVELIRSGKGELLMKGSLHTDELMRAVTASQT